MRDKLRRLLRLLLAGQAAAVAVVQRQPHHLIDVVEQLFLLYVVLHIIR